VSALKKAFGVMTSAVVALASLELWIWTEAYRPGNGGAMGFSVHTVCDFFGAGELREAVATTIGARLDEPIFRYSEPRQAPWELRQSRSGFPAVIEGAP
jgi:hypothetical protein